MRTTRIPQDIGSNLKFHFQMTTLNLILPTCWQELTPAQLRYAFYLLAQEFTAAEIKTYALVRWAPLTQVEKTDDGLFCHFEGKPCFITSEQIAAAIKHLDWLEKLPLVPVRLPSIGKLQPVEADLSGITFEAFLILENLYQGYLVTKDQALLSEMAAYLYQSPKPMELTPEEAISIFYWYASAKQLLARRYHNFFVNSEAEADTTAMQERLQQSMNNQIRALTKGDITKEKEVLAMDVHRALVELDAQAREYEELKKETAKP